MGDLLWVICHKLDTPYKYSCFNNLDEYSCFINLYKYTCFNNLYEYFCFINIYKYSCFNNLDKYSCFINLYAYSRLINLDEYSCFIDLDAISWLWYKDLTCKSCTFFHAILMSRQKHGFIVNIIGSVACSWLFRKH